MKIKIIFWIVCVASIMLCGWLTYAHRYEHLTEANPTEPTIDISESTTREVTEVAEATEAITTVPTIESTYVELPPLLSKPHKPIAKQDPPIDEHDVELLAMVIYQEAGSDYICDDCRRRVADVVLNRVNDDRFPNTIEAVLTQKDQYGVYYYTGVVWPTRAKYDGEAHAVERARQIAREVLEGNHSELYSNGYVWQAEFMQGTDGFWCCGIYFGRG